VVRLAVSSAVDGWFESHNQVKGQIKLVFVAFPLFTQL
jgi:hypothetical protein